MNPQTHSVLMGGSGLAIGWLSTWVPFIFGLVHGRASWGKFLMSPVVAFGATFLAGMINTMLGPLVPILGIDRQGVLSVCLGTLVCVAVGYTAGRAIAQRGKEDSQPQHRRGAVVSDTETEGESSFWGRDTQIAEPREGVITLAGMPVASADETKHFKFIGTTGTGKSTAIRELLSGALDRGDRAIIADPDGGYLDRFYDSFRGDVILNPFDGDAHKWDLFAEIENDYDIEQLARSLIPDSGDSERIWVDYARTFFSAVTRQAAKVRGWDESELFRLLTSAPREELRIMLAGTPAGPFLEEGNEKMFGSIRSVTSAAVRGLEYTTRQQAQFLSVRQWVRNGQGRSAGDPARGVLFLPYTAGQIAGLRSLISAWMRLAIFQAMDCAEGDQRLWFVIDEVDALGEIDGLKDALARVRKFGGRCVLGLQSIAQMSGTYGKGSADTIVENCGNTFILRCSASERGGTSEFASKLIGQREVLHTTRSRSLKGFLTPDATTVNESIKIEPAVMASEIERLPDLEGFLKLASTPDWRRVRLTPRNEPIVERPHRPLMTTIPPPPPLRSPVSAAPPSSPAPQPTPASAAAPPTPAPSKAQRGNASSKRVASTKRTRKPKGLPEQTSLSMDDAGATSGPAAGPNGVAPGPSGSAESEHRIL